MGFRRTVVFAIVLVSLAQLAAPQILSGAAFEPSLYSDVIAVGSNAIVIGTAAPGTRIAVSVAGPASAPPASGTAGADGKIMIPVGPFPARGSYMVLVKAGNDQKTLTLDVEDQVAAGAVTQAAEQFNQANNELMAALENSLNIMEQQINRFPPNDQGISQVRQGITRLREQYRDLSDFIAMLTVHTTHFSRIVERPTYQPSWNSWASYFTRKRDELRATASEVDAVSDPDAFEHASDWCARALQAKAVFLVLNTIIERARGSFKELVAEKITGFLAGAGTEAIMARVGQASPATRTSPLEEQISSNLAQSFAEGMFSVLTKSFAKIKWDLMLEAADFIVTSGLDVYMSVYCLSFTGRIKGHVRVAALDKAGAPYWGQDNDWEGDVTLTCAKPGSPGQAVPIWGIVHGKGKNFVGRNMLATLFPKTLASALFLTTQPNKLLQALAYFCMRLEGSLGGNGITLKLGSTWVDMFKGLNSEFASIVIPAGSPVPVVNTYKIPFQNAEWQLGRTLSREGTKYTIAMELSPSGQTQRRVRGDKTRELRAPGAYGVFTWKIDLCAGCPAEWKPDF